MNLAVIGFDFKGRTKGDTYLVFDKDAQVARFMTKAQLLNHNISDAKIENGLIKPIYPESKYFQEELFSSKMPTLQGYIIEVLANNTFKVYTNQNKIVQLSVEQVSKLYTVLNASIRFPEEGIKVEVLSTNGIPVLSTIKNTTGFDTSSNTGSAKPASQNKSGASASNVAELLNIFRNDIRGICVIGKHNRPKLHEYKPGQILNAMKIWVERDYPNYNNFINYVLKYPLLYPPKGKTPLLARRSYVYSAYELLKAQIVYDSAIQEVNSGKKVPTLPLAMRPYGNSSTWKIQLLNKLPAEQKAYLSYLTNPKSIYCCSNVTKPCLNNISHILYTDRQSKSIADYTQYNTLLYEAYLRHATAQRAQGKTVQIEGMNSADYIESLATLHLNIRDNNYGDYCFIKVPSGGYLKLTRPRRKADFNTVTPKVEVVTAPEPGVKTYELKPIKFKGTTLTVQIAELLLHYANRQHKHYEYMIEETNEMSVHRITDGAVASFILDDLSDVNDLLEYMYS